MRSVLFALALIGVLLATADAHKCYYCNDVDEMSNDCAHPKIIECDQADFSYCEWVSLNGPLVAGCTGSGKKGVGMPTGCRDYGKAHECVCNEDVRFNYFFA